VAAGDGVLESMHEGDLSVDYTDCNDGDVDR